MLRLTLTQHLGVDHLAVHQQLDKNYKDTKETIIDNCDSLLFLGSKSSKTNKEIVDYMVERYGDFVLYKPPFKANTVILWLGPVALFLVGFAAFYLNLRRRKSAVAKTVRPLTAEEKARADKLLSGDKE